MRRLGIAPNTDTLNAPQTGAWFSTVGERLNIYTGTSDPTSSDIPENQWIIFYNSTSLETRLWANVAGTVVKSAALT